VTDWAYGMGVASVTRIVFFEVMVAVFEVPELSVMVVLTPGINSPSPEMEKTVVEAGSANA